MNFPVDKNAFHDFIEESKIFELTRECLRQCLKNWYKDEPEQFMDGVI